MKSHHANSHFLPDKLSGGLSNDRIEHREIIPHIAARDDPPRATKRIAAQSLAHDLRWKIPLAMQSCAAILRDAVGPDDLAVLNCDQHSRFRYAVEVWVMDQSAIGPRLNITLLDVRIVSEPIDGIQFAALDWPDDQFDLQLSRFLRK